jgi:hypothetical protein
MKYQTEIIIHKSRQIVVELFKNINKQKEWQKNLKEIKTMNGDKRQTGDVNHLIFDNNNKVIEMKETVLENNLPFSFKVLYEANGIVNIIENKFTEVNIETTKWQSDVEFKFKGFMKIATILMKSAFKSQTNNVMSNFKEFVENNKS